jgi:RimJ/RimL family protein N-acetyltransferase
MRKNYETILCGDKVVLVPYRPQHVEKYHQWMKCPFLLEMTGSEPLSYEEEVQMQISWKDDENKCTFILLSKELCSKFLAVTETCNNLFIDDNFLTKSLDAMIGDVNLFLSDEDEDAGSSDGDDRHCEVMGFRQKQAELDIMVAEESFRGQGIGKESVCIMMMYGAEELGVRKFVVKIKENNTRSRLLFKVRTHKQMFLSVMVTV